LISFALPLAKSTLWKVAGWFLGGGTVGGISSVIYQKRRRIFKFVLEKLKKKDINEEDYLQNGVSIRKVIKGVIYGAFICGFTALGYAVGTVGIATSGLAIAVPGYILGLLVGVFLAWLSGLLINFIYNLVSDIKFVQACWTC